MALMSIPKIGGREARELLDGITGGQWFCYHDMYGEEGEPVSTLQAEYPDSDIAPVADGDGVRNPADGRLLAHAPALAETVAWLYGREADEGEGPDESKTYYGNGIWYIEADPEQGVSLGYDLFRGMTPGEAVGLARALLAAAEEARNV